LTVIKPFFNGFDTIRRSRAARLLGLTRDTLLYRLKKYSIA
jgi:DNA-binding protein Fis